MLQSCQYGLSGGCHGLYVRGLRFVAVVSREENDPKSSWDLDPDKLICVMS